MSYQDGVKNDPLLLFLFLFTRFPEILFALWTMHIGDLNLNSVILQGLVHVPFIWFLTPPEEGSTSLRNVLVTSAIYSIPALQSLLCNLLRRTMQTEVLILTIAAHSLYDSHPYSLIKPR